jgi:hypothetical protein
MYTYSIFMYIPKYPRPTLAPRDWICFDYGGRVRQVARGFRPPPEIIRNAAQQKIPRTQVIVEVDAVWLMAGRASLAGLGPGLRPWSSPLVFARPPGVAGLPRPPNCPGEESPTLFLEELLDDLLDIAMLGVDGVVEMAHVVV